MTLFEPYNNTRFYEGHIQEAILSYRRKNHEFRRKSLKDSTSMVMAPVDIQDPDFDASIFMKFKNVFSLPG